ncbi:MAG: cytochrome c [Planctomycetes bacterium]|nr:cytochrome c [Planctomycetota bacterium]
MIKLNQTQAMKSFTILIAAFVVLISIVNDVFCEESVPPQVAESSGKIKLLEDHKPYLINSKRTFLHYCAPCHGDKGNGRGIYFTIDLMPKPTDLTNVEYMANLTDDYLLNFVKSGSAAMEKSDLCPPWGGTLDEERLKGIIGYLRSLTIAKSSSDEKGAEDVVAPKTASSGAAPGFIKWAVLALLCLILIFAARKEWAKLKDEGPS